jgi:DNA repair photolyase
VKDETAAANEWFDIRNGRAMVSLGPLSPKRFCTYACTFCYVHVDFASYPSLPPERIVEYLRSRREEFDIVYVSGDTDSLSPPRTETGLELIDALTDLGTDVLFTTRAPLDEHHLDRLASTNRKLEAQGKILFGCVSISRLRSAPHIEPKPVPPPERRLEVLRGLHERGIVSVLAMRPFLPVVPPAEYVELATLAQPFVDVILGEVWYADKGGVLEKQVLGTAGSSGLVFVEHEMDFDSNSAIWKVWEATDVRIAVEAYCKKAKIPFFMRSAPAIEYIRSIRFRS